MCEIHCTDVMNLTYMIYSIIYILAYALHNIVLVYAASFNELNQYASIFSHQTKMYQQTKKFQRFSTFTVSPKVCIINF